MTTFTTRDGTKIYCSTLKVYKGLSHGMRQANRGQINADLLAFLNG